MNHANRFARWLPVWAVVLWCLFIGLAVWQHAQRSEQPPIYDAMAYFQKAQNFWHAVRERKWVNPLDLEPTFRPPGTVLMSYPFGFDIDFRGFYFRSVFWPVLLLALAPYIAAYSRRMDVRGHRNLALGAIFLTSLPIIYQFETTADPPASGCFGLVDNFLMGLAALAVAASLRSLTTRSVAWVATAAILASLCLLVKPAGAYVMALVGANWVLLALARMRGQSSSAIPLRLEKAWLVKGLVIFGMLYGATLAASLSSRYLSPENLAFGVSAIAIMQSEWALPPGAWIYVLPAVVRTSVGYPLPAVALVIGVLALLNRTQSQPRPAASEGLRTSALATAACVTLLFGIWFWVFGSGGLSGGRYFVPFPAMAAVYGLPLALTTLGTLPRWQTAFVQALCALAAINLALLLVQPQPPVEWQRWSGVNLTSGAQDANREQARQFVNEVTKGHRSVKLYALRVGPADQAYQSVADYHRASDPAAGAIVIRRPVDWARPSTYRIAEILGSDFILLEPVNDPALKTRVFAKPSIDNFDEEQLLFQAWATDLSTDDGVHVLFSAPSARLLRIDDRSRLEDAISRLERRHRWRNIFLTANPRRWWSEHDLARELVAHDIALVNANFSGQFKVHALSVSATDTDIAVKLWWEQLDAEAGSDWVFFVHALSNDGEILLNNGIGLAYWNHSDAERRIRYDVLTFRKPPNRPVDALGVGFYRTSDGYTLAADAGPSDGDRRRVILPVR